VTSSMHPLFGRALWAKAFKRWDGSLLLVVELPDGSPGTVAADATDVFGDRGGESPPPLSVLSVDGVRRLRMLLSERSTSVRSPNVRSPMGARTRK
jgi:hypothetical protein